MWCRCGWTVKRWLTGACKTRERGGRELLQLLLSQSWGTEPVSVRAPASSCLAEGEEGETNLLADWGQRAASGPTQLGYRAVSWHTCPAEGEEGETDLLADWILGDAEDGPDGPPVLEEAEEGRRRSL